MLGDGLPLIDDAVTVEHLLARRSGIGDYFDEDVVTDLSAYVLPVPAQCPRDTEQYLAALDGYPQKFPPGDGEWRTTCPTCRSAVAGTAASTPRRLTSARCGERCSPG